MPARRIGFVTCANYRNLASSERLTAEILRRMGHKVVPVVWTETPASTIDCDLMVIRSVWDYHLHVVEFLEWVDATAEQVPVLNSPGVVHWNAHKRYLLDLERGGLPVPRTLVLEKGTAADLLSMLHKQAIKKAVVKPAVSASAYETHLVSEANLDVQDRVNELLGSRTLILQEFVPDILTEGEWSLIFFGSEYSHAVRKHPKSGDFRVQAEHGGMDRPGTPPLRVRALAEQVISRFAATTLYARIDIVETERSPLIMELELIDPELFLAEEPIAEKFARTLVARMT